MQEWSQETSPAQKVRQKSFNCTGAAEARDVFETCVQVERMADLALGRMELLSRTQLSERDSLFRPGFRELAVAAHSNRLQERKIRDMGHAVAKAIKAIGEIQKNEELVYALRKIREGKGDITALEIICKELDDLEKNIFEG